MNRNEYYDALAHHGIKGQRKGHRNGPPYPLSAKAHSISERLAGKKGWSKEARKESSREKAEKMDVKELQEINKKDAAVNQYVKNHPDDDATTIAEGIRSLTNSSTDLARKIEKTTTKTVKTGVDVSKLSDKELQQIVNRLNLEQRYDQLTTKDVANKGAVYVREALELVGSIAVITSTIVSLKSKF